MPRDLRAKIGATLREKRQASGLSQEALAERAGIDRTYVSILERGLKSPTVETLEKVCRVLQTLPERLMEEARRKQ